MATVAVVAVAAVVDAVAVVAFFQVLLLPESENSLHNSFQF